jgi:hypothetical protein
MQFIIFCRKQVLFNRKEYLEQRREEISLQKRQRKNNKTKCQALENFGLSTDSTLGNSLDGGSYFS